MRTRPDFRRPVPVEARHQCGPFKGVAYRPGLGTVRCQGCRRVNLYEGGQRDWDDLLAGMKSMRRGERGALL